MTPATEQRTSYPSSHSSASSGSRNTGASDNRAEAGDESSLRSDIDALKAKVTDLISKAGTDAMKAAKQTTSDVADQVGKASSSIADAASEQAKTFASELERVGRNNPIGAIAGALLVGVVIGLIGRGRS